MAHDHLLLNRGMRHHLGLLLCLTGGHGHHANTAVEEKGWQWSEHVFICASRVARCVWNETVHSPAADGNTGADEADKADEGQGDVYSLVHCEGSAGGGIKCQ